MYACIHETGADFSRGCADKRIGNLLSATHPHHAAVREWFYVPAPCLSILNTANIHFLLQHLVHDDR
jgi:hypothetical protein